MKRIIFSLLLLVSALLTAPAQKKMVWTRHYQDYFDTYKNMAVEQMQRYHIPASITLAQGVLESAAGRSDLAVKGNNHFGIKCNGWTGRKTYHDDDAKSECFRAYNSIRESFEDHSTFLANGKRYQRLFQLAITDYKGWAQGLKDCGYATSPTYASKLIEIIELYQLYNYDRQQSYGLGTVVANNNTHQHGTTVQQATERRVYAFNDNYYVLARRGDSYDAIASDMATTAKKLAKYNERDMTDRLEEGEIVWLMKKARRAPKEYKDFVHVVSTGESIYTISQRYGIRLKYIYKINKLPADYQLRIGDTLRIR